MTNPVQLQEYLSGIDYPASKDIILHRATENNATEDVLSVLGRIPDSKYQTPADLSRALGDVL